MSLGTGKYARFVLLTLLQLRSNRNTISNICPQIRIDPLLEMFRFVLQLHHDLFSKKKRVLERILQVKQSPSKAFRSIQLLDALYDTSVFNPPCTFVILSGTCMENGAEKILKSRASSLRGLCLGATETRNINAESKPTFVDTNIFNRALNMGGVIVITCYLAHMTLVCTKVLKAQSDPIHGSPSDIPREISGLLLMFSSGIPLAKFLVT